MGGISRIHGGPVAEGFYGYQPIFLKVAGTNVGTADSGGGTSAVVDGNWTKSIRAIQRLASVVYLGTRANDQFVVAVDGPTAQAYISSNSDTDVAAAIQALVRTVTGVSGATVTDVSGLAAGVL